MALYATSAFAANTAGTIEFVSYSDGGAPTFDSQFEVNDNGSALVGVSGSVINLVKQASGYQGYALGRFLDVTCTATHCTDNGSAQLDITVTPVADGYSLSGTLNFVFVNATVTASKISLSAEGANTDVGFELDADSAGNYSGDGTDGYGTFTATLTTGGSLAGLTDPATFVALMVNPFVGN